MSLTEKEKNLILASLRYDTEEDMLIDIEKAVARCEQDAKAEGRKEAELEFSEGQIKELIDRQRKEARAEERKRILIKLEGCIRQYEALKQIGGFEKEEYREGKLSAYKWVKAELEKGD